MKKTMIAAIALIVASVSSYAQGNVNFGGSPHEVWTATNTVSGASVTTPVTTGGFDVALVFGSTSSTALAAIGAASSTNALSNSQNYSDAAAWADIEHDLANGFALVDGTTSGTPLVAAGGGTGSFSYNTGSSWSSSNVNGGTAYDAYEVAWNTDDGTLTTLAEAEAANAYVGWSEVFAYTPASGAGQPTAINATLAGYYGVGGLQTTSTPEPGTMALAGLGSLSLLFFRRKK